MKRSKILSVTIAFIILTGCSSVQLSERYTYLNKVPVNQTVETIKKPIKQDKYLVDNELANHVDVDIENNDIDAIYDKHSDNLAYDNVDNLKPLSFVQKKQVVPVKAKNIFPILPSFKANHFKQHLNEINYESIADTDSLTKVLIGLLILALILIVLDLILPGDVFAIISTIILVLILVYAIYFLFKLL